MNPEIDFEFARGSGATHYDPASGVLYRSEMDAVCFWSVEKAKWVLSSYSAHQNDICNIPIPLAKADEPGWTIYNNTLPLLELSDEQAAKIFNAWRACRPGAVSLR